MRQAVRAELTTVGTPSRTQILELVKRGVKDLATHQDALTAIYGDSRLDTDAVDLKDAHPENLQRIRQDVENGFRELRELIESRFPTGEPVSTTPTNPDVTPPSEA